MTLAAIKGINPMEVDCNYINVQAAEINP